MGSHLRTLRGGQRTICLSEAGSGNWQRYGEHKGLIRRLQFVLFADLRLKNLYSRDVSSSLTMKILNVLVYAVNMYVRTWHMYTRTHTVTHWRSRPFFLPRSVVQCATEKLVLIIFCVHTKLSEVAKAALATSFRILFQNSEKLLAEAGHIIMNRVVEKLSFQPRPVKYSARARYTRGLCSFLHFR